jgi:FkbM family methyltransferase
MIVGFESYADKYDFSNVKGIVHVGAHEGQEYEEYIKRFGDIQTHWFEPLKFAFAKLLFKLGTQPGAKLYNYALGPDNGKTRIWQDNGNEGQSSSLLKPKEHTKEWTHITFDEGEEVEVRTLDSFEFSEPNMLVLDVQGYELEVLKGAIKTLPHIDHVFCEINSKEMYEGCPTVEQLDQFLQEHGFALKEQWWTSNNWGDGYWSRIKE